MKYFDRVAVLGSGVMGSAIAAHLANCGIPSLMLDIVPPDLSDKEKSDARKRNQIAADSKQKLLKSRPSPLYSASYLDMIDVGNFEDDMDKISECGWIVEVVKEELSIKQKVFKEVAKHRKPGTIVSTNTSGIPIASMLEVMDDDFKAHFLGTHFFNPPRYLKLVEIIPHDATKQDVIDFMAKFLENKLGKGVVYAKDTPNFIANRILTFSSQFILHNMRDDDMTVEEVDAVTGEHVGHASSATFRTLDLVGLDTYRLVVSNVRNNCPDDERIDLMEEPDFIKKMTDKGYIGEKAGSGFYKATKERDEKGKRIILGLDLGTLEYRDPVKAKFDCTGKARNAETLEEKIKVMHTGDDKGSQFAWKVFANSAIYAANRIPEIADDIVNIDNAAKWGFAWEVGIFETWDILGFDYVCDRMKEDGLELPPIVKAMKDAGADAFYRTENGKRRYFDLEAKGYKDIPVNPNILQLDLVKEAKDVVDKNGSCSLIDLGDGVICAEFHTRMNSIDPDMGEMLQKGVTMLEENKFEGMVIGNQGDHFCVGANVFLILGEAMQGNWDRLSDMINQLQQGLMAIRYCDKPIVSAPHHFTMGGGTEICQHTARQVICGETYGGLVEVGVGLIPAGGGCKEMVRRALACVPKTLDDPDPFPYIRRAFQNIATADVSTSGVEYTEKGYLSETESVIEPNFDMQIQRAKDTCLGLIKMGYDAPRPPKLWALGEGMRAAFKVATLDFKRGGYASGHDALISDKLAWVLTGGDRQEDTPMTEQDFLDLEREAFLSLAGTEKTQQRMQHMLQSGKPLRN